MTDTATFTREIPATSPTMVSPRRLLLAHFPLKGRLPLHDPTFIHHGLHEVMQWGNFGGYALQTRTAFVMPNNFEYEVQSNRFLVDWQLWAEQKFGDRLAANVKLWFHTGERSWVGFGSDAATNKLDVDFYTREFFRANGFKEAWYRVFWGRPSAVNVGFNWHDQDILANWTNEPLSALERGDIYNSSPSEEVIREVNLLTWNGHNYDVRAFRLGNTAPRPAQP